MKYKSTNELATFSFKEAVIASISANSNTVTLDLDNITILAANSNNRDIRDMRANNVILTFTEASITKLYQESYNIYDADNNLKETVPERIIAPEAYGDFFKSMQQDEEFLIYDIEKISENSYKINIDGLYDTFVMEVQATDSTVEWDRFLSK
ncbi:MAG: subtilin biosynthesis sensor protein SpaK [Lachnospiraceae bacterium]|nr:subtilin biosynthesis sensor protein SpaK [Lachnospiraceae bacterium]